MERVLQIIVLLFFNFHSIAQEPEKAVVVKSDANVYSKPDYSSEKIKTINLQDTIEVLDYYQGKPYESVLFWVVDFNGKRGYISSRNLSFLNSDFDQTQFVYKLSNSESHVKSEKEREKERILRKLDSVSIKNEFEFKLRDSIRRNKCSFIQNEIDEFENVKKILTEPYNIINEPFAEINTSLKRINKKRYLMFETSFDLGCASPYETNQSYVKIKLENDEIVTFYHRGNIDCGNFTLFALLTNNDILSLKNSMIKSIRLSGTEYYKDFNNIRFKDFFIKKIKCLDY